MGIGRRKFLKLFGAVIATAATNPLQAVIINDDLYINRTLGLAYKKPLGWHFLSLESFADIKEKQQLLDSDTTEILKTGDDPIAIISQYPESSGITFSPSITIYVENFELLEGENLQQLVSTLSETYSKALVDYQFIESPKAILVSDCEAAEYVSTFIHQQEGKEALCRHKSIVIVRDSQMYTVNVFDYPELGRTIDEEYLEFKDAFKLV
ncbi:hypothetical protein H4J57_09840 [Colwellia sp. BRX8-7]|uniref:hypothetical protein n=1 Tax=Colwellia sp. BRX8-7 TaxID=2759833 RepID=UPI0015F3B24E|nr:hypothetical protein [Colwellia sp. BRX8-7]MBA6337501.1 hypothetical protein [Colwellia sp. BRX8-7]